VYSKRQIEIAEEHGVVLKTIPVLDLMPFDKIFIDTQETEDMGRVIKYFTPHAVFKCNCHLHVPQYNRRKKIMETLIDDNGKKHMDDSYDMYINKVEHTHYCGQLARYRYENDYSTNDQKIKYAPKKSHLIFTGQDMGLHTVTYTFEKDEEVLIVLDTGKTRRSPITIEDGQQLVNMAENDEEIENTERYFDYMFNSWFISCSRIHDHHDDERYDITLQGHTNRLVDTLQDRIKLFTNELKDIVRLNKENYDTDDATDEEVRKMYRIKDYMRYIVKTTHYNIHDDIGSSLSLYSRENTTYDEFINTVSLIEEIEDRLIATNKQIKKENRKLRVEDYFFILYGDKLKRKYEIVV
jgi:hypothetical protein